MHHLRSSIAAVVACFVAAPAWSHGFCEQPSLDILVTNDDGFDAVGIRSLAAALRSAGHNVRVVAPATNQSGQSVALTFAAIPVKAFPGDVYSVAGTPATAVILGVTGIYGSDAPPDLVVSGINDGANLGPATVISGTVGATIAALQTLEPAIPGIAVSTDRRNPGEKVDSPVNTAHFEQVAEFTARLVTQLQQTWCRNGVLASGNTALNVNYPPLPREQVKGVRVREQGQASYFKVAFVPVGQGIYAPSFTGTPPTDDIATSDTTAFREGFVTVVPIDGDYTAVQPIQSVLKGRLQGLTP